MRSNIKLSAHVCVSFSPANSYFRISSPNSHFQKPPTKKFKHDKDANRFRSTDLENVLCSYIHPFSPPRSGRVRGIKVKAPFLGVERSRRDKVEKLMQVDPR